MKALFGRTGLECRMIYLPHKVSDVGIKYYGQDMIKVLAPLSYVTVT